jgi:hypothetical protein
MASLHNVLLFVRELGSAIKFFEVGLQLKTLTRSATAASLAAGPVTVTLRHADYKESLLSCGYSPFLNFVVQDMDTTMHRLVALGAHMDGAVKYEEHGKVCRSRASVSLRLSLLCVI